MNKLTKQNPAYKTLALSLSTGLLAASVSTISLAERGILPSQQLDSGELQTAPKTEQPPLKLPDPAEKLGEQQQLSQALSIFVKEIQFSGNTVYSDEQLLTLLKTYLNRKINARELEQIRLTITNHYVNNGYINSGALIPDQDVEGGVLKLQIVEGKLNTIEVQNQGRLADKYIADKLLFDPDQALNLEQLQNKLLLLQHDPRIQRIDAALQPGAKRGESQLDIHVKENKPYFLSIEGNNYRAPAIGEGEGIISAGHLNVTGAGDSISLGASSTEGLESYNLNYQYPISHRNTTALTVDLYKSQTTVTDNEIASALDIDNKSYSAAIGYFFPLLKTPREEYLIHIKLDNRQSESFLDGASTSFTLNPGEEISDGKKEVTALRLTQSWQKHSDNRVISFRHTVSKGFKIFDATSRRDAADGDYASWLGQLQIGHQLKTWNMRTITRINMQLAADKLLPLEQFSVGGRFSVRGYRENQFVRDNGFTTTLELRIPVFYNNSKNQLETAFFYDIGSAWNYREASQSDTISSVGLGLRWNYHDLISTELYWAEPLEDLDIPNADSLQDDGLHIGIKVNVL